MEEKFINKHLFLRFLKENGLYHRYKHNLLEQRKNVDYTHYFNSMNNINCAFTWGCTKEGYEFWYKISKKINTITYGQFYRKTINKVFKTK